MSLTRPAAMSKPETSRFASIARMRSRCVAAGPVRADCQVLEASVLGQHGGRQRWQRWYGRLSTCPGCEMRTGPSLMTSLGAHDAAVVAQATIRTSSEPWNQASTSGSTRRGVPGPPRAAADRRPRVRIADEELRLQALELLGASLIGCRARSRGCDLGARSSEHRAPIGSLGPDRVRFLPQRKVQRRLQLGLVARQPPPRSFMPWSRRRTSLLSPPRRSTILSQRDQLVSRRPRSAPTDWRSRATTTMPDGLVRLMSRASGQRPSPSPTWSAPRHRARARWRAARSPWSPRPGRPCAADTSRRRPEHRGRRCAPR